MIHRETYPSGLGWLVVAQFVLTCGAILAWDVHQDRLLTVAYLVVLAAPLGLSALCVAWLFRGFTVEFGPRGAVMGIVVRRWGFPIVRLPVEQIEDARPAEQRWPGNPGGFRGFLRGPYAFRVFKTRSGIQLQVVTRPGRTRAYFFPCREPQRALQAMGVRRA